VYLCMSVSSLASLSLCSSFKSSSASLPIFAANRFVCHGLYCESLLSLITPIRYLSKSFCLAPFFYSEIGKCVNNNNNVCTQLVMLDKT